MALNTNLIQQHNHIISATGTEVPYSELISAPQLRKISTLEHVTDITSENEGLINSSYLLLTTPNIKNFTLKFNTLVNKFGTVGIKDRLDQLELGLQAIRDSLHIDNISQLIWSGYNGIDGFESVCIVDSSHHKNFSVTKGILTATHNDGTPNETIDVSSDDVEYILFNQNGELVSNYKQIIDKDENNNCRVQLVDANNKVLLSGGTYKIGIRYKDHIGVINSENEIAGINFKVVVPQYTNYLWIVDSSHLSLIINDSVFNTNSITYACGNSTACPMSSGGTSYNAQSIITTTFNVNQSNISNNALYIILPKSFCNIISTNQNKMKINGKWLKSGSLGEIVGIIEESTFIVNQHANPVATIDLSTFTKDIIYGIYKIEDSINSGQDLNIN